MTARLRRAAARALYREVLVCFACGRLGDRPCPGHEYGGVITQWRRRRWAPGWLAARVDCRWTLRPGPHPLQEYNAHGNTCHRRGCTLTAEQHDTPGRVSR